MKGTQLGTQCPESFYTYFINVIITSIDVMVLNDIIEQAAGSGGGRHSKTSEHGGKVEL